MPTIPHFKATQPAGGILPLHEAIAEYPVRDLVFYNRVSSWEGAGKGMWKLREKTDRLIEEIEKIAPGRIEEVFFGVELGQMSAKRPALTTAIEHARHNKLILCARNVPRFIRAEDYDRRTNPDAEPTQDEWVLFWETVGNVIVATVDDPMLTEAERHKRDTKRSEKCGRPPQPFEPKLALQILEMLGMPVYWNGRIEWEVSITKVAKHFGVARAKVQRLLDELMPVPPGQKGQRWKDCYDPARAYKQTWKEGLL
jgi:hypothetical protein